MVLIKGNLEFKSFTRIQEEKSEVQLEIALKFWVKLIGPLKIDCVMGWERCIRFIVVEVNTFGNRDMKVFIL